MPDCSRREVLHSAASVGLLGSAGAFGASVQDGDGAPTDRDHVMAAGMTEGEAECWRLAAECAGAFFALPELHPMDRQEIASAIHIVQNKLLSRPTYRKYLAAAKAAHGEAP